MAAVSDCFSIGSTVLCTTCFNEDVEGEVVAFDHNTKMLMLKCQSTSGDHLSDVHVLNLSLCSNVQVIKECNGNSAPVDQVKLNLEQLRLRLRKTEQHRQTYLKSKNADVSPEAQELYRVIAKQFKYHEVTWQGRNIQIFNEVIIRPPYKAENVEAISDNRGLLTYIKKMIEQFINTRASQEKSLSISSNSSSASSSLSSAPSASVGSNSTSSSSSSNTASASSPVTAN